MKQSCPKCKTIIEINEKEYEPGSVVKKLCPLCGASVSFTIGGNEPISAAAFAKLGKDLEGIKNQLGEVQASNKKLEETLSETLELVKKQSTLIASQIANNNSQRINNHTPENKDNTARHPEQNGAKEMKDCNPIDKTAVERIFKRERGTIRTFLLLGLVLIIMAIIVIRRSYYILYSSGFIMFDYNWPLWLLLILGIIIAVVSIYRLRKIKNESTHKSEKKKKQNSLPNHQQSESSKANDSVSKRNTNQVASPNHFTKLNYKTQTKANINSSPIPRPPTGRNR